ncbi:MAG: carboxypeptidase-like regulatory domain-containing protein, partial [Terracidiphilus sp.]
MRQAKYRFFLLPLFVLLACTAAVFAQENAELTGTVTDPAGAVISNASVTLTNVATNEVRAGKSNG